MADRYTKIVLTVIALALAALAARPLLEAQRANAGAWSDTQDPNAKWPTPGTPQQPDRVELMKVGALAKYPRRGVV